MSVWIPHHETCRTLVVFHRAGRNVRVVSSADSSIRCGHERGDIHLPVPVIVCARVDRHRAAGARREVLEQLDTGAARGAQRGDSQTRAEHVVEALLLDAKVLTRARDFQSECISIETEARVGVGDDDRGVIDAEAIADWSCDATSHRPCLSGKCRISR